MKKTIEERVEELEIWAKRSMREEEHRWYILKDRIDIVYERMVILANAESKYLMENNKE